MTEVITVIAVGVGISGLILNGQRNAREEMKEFKAEMKEFKAEMDARFEKIEDRLGQIEGRLGVLERQQAKLEGLLDGLREAISGRAMSQNKAKKRLDSLFLIAYN